MNSIAAAKRRRAQPEGTKPAMTITPTPPPPQPTAQRMTPQQYLFMLESKISTLEKNMSSQPSVQIEVNGPDGKKKMDLSDYMADVDQKFMVLAEEISSLKDSLLKLQTFTMDVNQTMFNKLSKEETQEENTQNMSPTVNEVIVNDTTVNDTTVNNTTVNDTTVNEVTVNDTTVNETTANDTTVNDTTVNDTTVNDTTVNDTTVNETTVNEETNDENEIVGITKNKKGRKKH